MKPQFSQKHRTEPKPFGRQDMWKASGDTVGLSAFYDPDAIKLVDDAEYEKRLHDEFIATIFAFSRQNVARWFGLMGGNARVADRILAAFPGLKRASVLRAVQRHGAPQKANRKQQYSVSKPWQAKYYSIFEQHLMHAAVLLVRVYGGVLVSSDHRRRDGENDYATADIPAAMTNLALAVQGEIEGAQFEFLSTSCDAVEVEITWRS